MLFVSSSSLEVIVFLNNARNVLPKLVFALKVNLSYFKRYINNYFMQMKVFLLFEDYLVL